MVGNLVSKDFCDSVGEGDGATCGAFFERTVVAAVGLRLGIAIGRAVGIVVGRSVDAFRFNSVRPVEGDVVDSDRTTVGEIVGCIDGERDACTLRSNDGAFVGATDVVEVGFKVGEVVELDVGSFDGASDVTGLSTADGVRDGLGDGKTLLTVEGVFVTEVGS